MRAVLSGWGNIPTGVGSELRWLSKLFGFDAWYQGRHPILGFGEDADWIPVFREGENWDGHSIDADVVVAVERFYPLNFPKRDHRKCRLVVMANPEQAGSVMTWADYAHVVVSRTNQADRHLRKLGLRPRRRAIPVDLSEFSFRQRERVRDVVFTNGFGGTHERKGFPEVREMLALDPGCATVFSQRPITGVQYKGNQKFASDIYEDADLVLMPSRFEGLGLTLFEAMASGCIVAATDAEPMNEFLDAAYGPEVSRDLLLRVASTETVTIGSKPWMSAKIDPSYAVRAIAHARSWSREDVMALSLRGRQYVERVHGAAAVEQLREDIWGA